MYMNVPWVVLVTETHGGFYLVGFRKALLRFWWAISPQVHNHCTGGPGKWWAATGGPGERHWNRGWAEAVKATCNGHQCYTGAMGALLLGHHDHAQNFEQRQKDSAQWYFNLTSEYLFFYHCQHISTTRQRRHQTQWESKIFFRFLMMISILSILRDFFSC